MKIKLGKNYWLEVLSAKECDRKYGSDYYADGALLILTGIRKDTEKEGEERFSDSGYVFRNGKLRILSRGTYVRCTVKEFIENLRWTLN